MAQNAFVQSMRTIAESLINKAGFDKTRTGKIVTKNELTNTYSVKVDGHVYPNVKVTNDATYNIGDTVKVVMPCNQPSQLLIVSSIFSDASIGKKIGHAEALINAIDGSLEEVTEIDGHIYQIDITSVYGEESSAHTGHIYKDGTDVTDATYWNKFRWYLLTSSGKERQTDGVSNATLTMGIDRYLYGMSLILEWVDANDGVLLRKTVVLINNEKIADIEEYASNAYELADNTDNYFWHVESGTDTGAHITRVPKNTFLSATTDSARGYNFLAKPEGVALRYGLTELGHFTVNGVDFQAYQNGTLYKTAELTPNALNFYYLGRKMADMSADGVKFYDGEATPTEIASFSKDALSFNSAIPFSIGNGSRYIQWTGSGLNIITDSLYIGNQNIDTTISQAASATYRATCSTSSSTANKTATCAGFALTAGATIALYMTQANTTTNALTLNINGTGAKAIYVNGTATGTTNQLLWSANATITFTYNGTYWYVADGAGTLYGSTCSTNASTAGKTTTASSVAIFSGVSIVVPMTNDNTSTSATLNVSSLGARNIYYGNTSTRPTVANGYSWVANSTATFTFDGRYWRLDDASASKKASDAYNYAGEAYGYADSAYQNAEDAKKVATNYMYFDGTGLRIASASPSSSNSRTYITPDYISMYDSSAKRRLHLTNTTLTLGRNDANGNRYVEITDTGGLYLKYRADSSHAYNLAEFTASGMKFRDTSNRELLNLSTTGLTLRGIFNSTLSNCAIYGADGLVVYGYTNGTTRGEIAKIYSGLGNAQTSGTTKYAPYYTFGTRIANMDVGNYSCVIGISNAAVGHGSYAEGGGSVAQGLLSHAEGNITEAIGNYSHAEGDRTIARGKWSHAEGIGDQNGLGEAAGDYSHCEGAYTLASGMYSHSEGAVTEARGNYSHAGGYYSISGGRYSFAHGQDVYVGYDYQVAIGRYNNNKSTSLFEIGYGTSGARANVFAVTTAGALEIGAPATTFIVRSTSSTASFTGTHTFDLTAPTVSGYTPICFLNWNVTGSTQTYCYGVGSQGNISSVTIKLRNTSSSTSITCVGFWLYCKTA